MLRIPPPSAPSLLGVSLRNTTHRATPTRRVTLSSLSAVSEKTTPPEQRVVDGGERPELNKSWPDRLCKLLASAWHADHTKRPTAAQIVAELSTIKAELPTKYLRQRPSFTASAPNGGGGGGGGGGGSGVGGGGGGSEDRRRLFSTPKRRRSGPRRTGSEHGHDARGGATRTKPRVKPGVSPSPSRPEPSSEKSRRPYLLAKRSGSDAATADMIVEEEGNGHGDVPRGREGGEVEGQGEAERTKGGGDFWTGQPLHRRRNSRQREVIMDALAREAGAEMEADLLPERRTPRRLAQRETGYARAGGHSDRKQTDGIAGVKGIPQAGTPSASASATVPASAPASTVGDVDAVAAVPAQKEGLQQAQRSSSAGKRPPLKPPRAISETSARVRHIPARHPATTTTTKRVCADTAVSLVARNSNRDEKATAAAAATGEERDGNEGVSRGARKNDESPTVDRREPLSSDNTNLLIATAAEGEAEEEDEGDISGRTSRGVSLNSSLSDSWSSALPVFATGRNIFYAEGPSQPQGQADPTLKAGVAGATSEKETVFFSVLGIPSGESGAEDIEARLDRLIGGLSLSRLISHD